MLEISCQLPLFQARGGKLSIFPMQLTVFNGSMPVPAIELQSVQLMVICVAVLQVLPTLWRPIFPNFQPDKVVCSKITG
jgi:hypothetical protein